MKHIAILGSTGSIGQSTLDVVACHPDKLRVLGLAEGHDPVLLARQIEKFRPKLVSVRDEKSAKELKHLLKNPVESKEMPEIVFGIEGTSLVASMSEVDTVVSAIVGAAGLVPTIEAIKSAPSPFPLPQGERGNPIGKTIALANKETMVIAGELVTKLAKEKNVRILPVDSEHSAIFQSLVGHRRQDILRIILTASGGPFRSLSAKQMEEVTLEEALRHPRWTMGAKITIDSATLMNKGLEVIEARWLFDAEPEKIDVIIHPESIIHSMVEYCDGCVIAELGMPDMRAPIAYALSYPERISTEVKRLNFSEIGSLTFEAPNFDKFPCLKLAYESLKAGRSSPVVLNAANEVAVDAFLKKKINFVTIAKVVSETLSKYEAKDCQSVEEILEVDRWARSVAQKAALRT